GHFRADFAELITMMISLSAGAYSKPLSVACGNGIAPGFFGGSSFTIPPVTSLLIQGRPYSVPARIASGLNRRSKVLGLGKYVSTKNRPGPRFRNPALLLSCSGCGAISPLGSTVKCSSRTTCPATRILRFHLPGRSANHSQPGPAALPFAPHNNLGRNATK